jgi:hypothetical protein
VNGITVLQSSASLITTHLLGAKDSLVTMVFLRGDENEKVVVHLTRQIPVNLHQQGIQSDASGVGIIKM